MVVRRGVMGGTFDPIHYGHLVAAEAARDEFGLEQVLFVPAGQPPHKQERRVSDARHRHVMTVLATISNAAFEVSAIELDRAGPSYTVDTLKTLAKTWGPDVEIYFITGVDAVLEILTWKDPEKVLRTARYIAATRPGYSSDALDELRRSLPHDLGSRIHTLTVPALAISSSNIRARVRRGASIRYLLPESVEAYVHKMNLYCEVDG